ncbi:unnamed protein product [Penicillium manginii]
MPYLADNVSREWALTVAIIFDLGAIIQTAAPKFGTLVAWRAIVFVGVGTLTMTAPLYISEMSPPNLRGTLLVLESVSIIAGVMIAYWITFGTRFLEGNISFPLPWTTDGIFYHTGRLYKLLLIFPTLACSRGSF